MSVAAAAAPVLAVVPQTAGAVRPVPEGSVVGSREKRRRTDDGESNTTTNSPSVTTAAAAAVLAAGAGSAVAAASPVTAAAAAVLASTGNTPNAIATTTHTTAPSSLSSSSSSHPASCSAPGGDTSLGSATLRAEPPTLFQPSASIAGVGEATAVAQPPTYPYATAGPSPYQHTAAPLPVMSAGGVPGTTMLTATNTPWNMNFNAAPAGGGYYASAAAVGGGGGGGSAAAYAHTSFLPATHATPPTALAPVRPPRVTVPTAAAATPPTLPSAMDGGGQPDWMSSLASQTYTKGNAEGEVQADQEGNAYSFPQEIPTGTLTSTVKPLHRVVDANNSPPTIWGYPGPGGMTPSAYLQREVVELPSKFRPPQVTVAADNDAWSYSTGTGAVYPTGAPLHLLSQAEDAAGMPAGTLTKNKSGHVVGPKHTVRAKDAHRRAEQRRRGEQSNEQAKLKDCLGLQPTTSLADTLHTASNTVVQLRETETLLVAELTKQKERRAKLESQQEVRMVRTVMLQKQLREEVKKGDASKFIGKVDNAQSEMTVALLAMGKGFGSGGNEGNDAVDEITILS